MQTQLTHDTLPKGVEFLMNEISELKRLILKNQVQQKSEPQEELLTIKEAANLLHLSVPTLYSKNSKGEIPNVCKRGKRLYFSKQSLIEWIKEGRQKSNLETTKEAEEFLTNKKGLK